MKSNIVIGGISGRFPESSNCEEFKDNLYRGVDMISNDDRRWPPGLYGAPSRTGKIKDVSSFDAEFFGIHPKLANVMDPQLRMLLELTHESIMDAGFNPEELRGTKTGVYIGLMTTEANDYAESTPENLTGYETIGSTRAMLANRLSFAFDFSGPCCTIDTACSSTLFGLHLAVTAINNGECENAIIGGVNLTLKPATSLMYHKYSMLSPTGTISPFDVAANGYVRSEAAVVIYVTKQTASRRIYAHVMGTATNTDGHKKQGQTFPSHIRQAELMKEVYKKTNVDPADVGYCEAHGTGTSVGDVQETTAITEVFCKNRKSPLLIGSVKSNCGHTEPVSGLVSIVKAIFTFESGLLPPNINYSTSNPNITGLVEGKLKVVNEVQPLVGEYIAINSFGVGGTNAHVLLKKYSSEVSSMVSTKYKEPRLVCVQGRNKNCVEHLLNETKSKDDVFLSLLDHINSIPTPGYKYRGFIIHNSHEIEIQQSDPQKRPIWFLFSGMGSQWIGMGRELLKVGVFRDTIKKCDKVLEPMGVSLVELYQNPNDNVFKSPVNVMTGVIGMQIGLVNVLRSVGVEPDGIFGHSIGELSCSYADGGFTLEETILAAYWRGKVLVEAKPIKGAMVAVGLGWDEINKRLPNGIIAACHNSSDSVTISGPQEEVRKLAEELRNEKIFAKEVDSLGFAFHSPYLASAAKLLKTKYDTFMNATTDRPRTSRWISTSYNEKEWTSDNASQCSTEYHLHNVLSPVLFHQALQHIPSNAIIIEIAPHPLLQAILKRSLPSSVKRVTITNKTSTNAVSTLLVGLGNLFINGVNIELSNLYGKGSYPVPRGTPMISPLLRWDHSIQYQVPSFVPHTSSSENIFEISLNNEEYRSVAGHKINERILYPAAGYMTLVWKVLAKTKKDWFENISVQFEDIRFLKATVLSGDAIVNLKITILSSSGRFEITENETIVVDGKVNLIQDEQDPEKILLSGVEQRPMLSKEDIYKELGLRGYNYADIYQGIAEANVQGTEGKLEWKNDWTSFIDTVLQFRLLSLPFRDLRVPTHIKRVTIHPKRQLELPKRNDQNIKYDPTTDTLLINGIQIQGMTVTPTVKRRTQVSSPVHESYEFSNFFWNEKESLRLSRKCILEILLGTSMENISQDHLKVLDLVEKQGLSLHIKHVIEKEPRKTVDMMIYSNSNENSVYVENNIKVVQDISNGFTTKEEDKFDIIISDDIFSNYFSKLLKNWSSSFIIFIHQDENPLRHDNLCEVSRISQNNYHYSLLHKIPNQIANAQVNNIRVSSKSFDWVSKTQDIIKDNDDLKEQIIIFESKIDNNEDEPSNGVIALVKCLNQEYAHTHLHFRCTTIETSEPLSDVDIKSQLKKGLLFNVYQNGTWGNFRHRSIKFDDNDNTNEENAELIVDKKVIEWVQTPKYLSNKADEIFKVHYIMPIGVIPETECLQFSGITNNGSRVLGLTASKAIKRSYPLDQIYTWVIPSYVELDEAVVLPVTFYSLVYYCLDRFRVSSTDHILINCHSVTHLAVAQWLLQLKMNIISLIHEEQIPNLMNFPLLNENNTITDDTLSISKHDEFDVVITSNQSSNEILSKFLSVGGTFIIIGTLFEDMSPIIPGVDYFNATYDILFQLKDDTKQKIHEHVKQLLIRKDKFPKRQYSLNEITKPQQSTTMTVFKIEQKNIAIKKRTYFNPEKSYIVLGGLGGFGLELCEWMIVRNCRHLVISSRNGIQNGYQKYFVNRWRTVFKVNVRVCTSDVTSDIGVRELICDAEQIKPVDGIFNLAGILRDGMFENQTIENFDLLYRTKVLSTLGLDKVTRNLKLNLKYFVTFSSITSGRGNKGQSNYGFANSCMEHICNLRKKDNLAGMAIQWGPIADVGMAAKLLNQNRNKVIGGALAQSIESCLESLDMLLTTSSSVIASSVIPRKVIALDENYNETVTLKKVIGDILGVQDMNAVNDSITLSDLGLDSLMSADVKNVLLSKFNLNLPVEQIKELKFNNLDSLPNKK